MLRASESSQSDLLWAKAAELERDFAAYKRRLAEKESSKERTGTGTGRGRRYEEYVKRRDERLRQEWRARMEAEMKALWARLDHRAGGGSRGRRSTGDGELTSASHDDDADQKRRGSLEVKAKPIAPVTPRRCSPAATTKLARPRGTSVASSSSPVVAASPRLSSTTTPDARLRRPSSHLQHRHLPPATPRKENNNRVTPPPAPQPATPRPRTTLSRSRSMFKDKDVRGSYSSSGRDYWGSPRPPRVQRPPRASCVDGVRDDREAPRPSPNHEVHDADVVVVRSRPCFSEHDVLARLNNARAVAPDEPFNLGRSGGNGGAEEPHCIQVARAGCDADNKSTDDGDVHQSSESDIITGDSDTEASYVYIKRDKDDRTPRSFRVSSAGPGTCPQAELRSEEKNSPNANAIAGESPVTDDADEASSRRRASSETLYYSNVRSSFSQRSAAELDNSSSATTTSSPLRHLPYSCATTPPTDPSPAAADDDAARPRKNLEGEDAETKESPGSGVTVSITTVQPSSSAMDDAMAGLKRLLTTTFGSSKNSSKAVPTAVEVATTVVDGAWKRVVDDPAAPPPAAAGAPHSGTSSRGWSSSAGDSVKGRTAGFSNSDAVAPDDLDRSYVISPHAANHELKEPVLLHASKSPRVHRSFFSLSSFKSRPTS